MNPWRVCQLEFGLEYFCHPTWTCPSLLRCLKLRKNLHRFPKTVSQLPWIIHRLPCQPFPSELLSTEETVSLKMVGNLFCGSSNLAEAQFLERDISLKFLRQYFCCCCFLFFLQAPQTKFHLLPLYLGKGRNPRGRYLSLTTWANKIQIFCLAELIQIGLCVDLSIKFKWFLKRP